MVGKEAQLSPKPSLQEPTTFATGDPTETPGLRSKEPEVTKMEEEILEAMDQTTTSNQIIKPRDGKLAERQEQRTERSLLFMIASGVVCQTMGHHGYGWCVSLLTLLAMGAQGQDVKEPWTPYVEMPEDAAEAREGVSLETPEPQRSPAREPSHHIKEDRQMQVQENQTSHGKGRTKPLISNRSWSSVSDRRP